MRVSQGPDGITFIDDLMKFSRHDASRVFRDILYIFVCCFTMGKMEEEYLERIKPYSREELGHMQKLLADISNEDRALEDLFGQTYMDVASKWSKSGLGQFFTPTTLCEVMAQMTLPEKYANKILDPACGSGRTLLASAKQFKQLRRLAQYYVAIDLDEVCVNMCTLNMFLNGLQGRIIHGNSLSLECYKGYEIGFTERGIPDLRPLTIEECNQTMRAGLKEAPKKEEQQLELF